MRECWNDKVSRSTFQELKEEFDGLISHAESYKYVVPLGSVAVEAGLIADPTEAGLIADPAEAGLIADPTEADLIADPAEAGLIADPAEAGLIADPAETGLIADPAEAGLIADPAPVHDQPTSSSDCEPLAHLEAASEDSTG